MTQQERWMGEPKKVNKVKREDELSIIMPGFNWANLDVQFHYHVPESAKRDTFYPWLLSQPVVWDDGTQPETRFCRNNTFEPDKIWIKEQQRPRRDIVEASGIL